MFGKIGKYALLLGIGIAGAQESSMFESSSSCFLCLPDTLSNELQTIASDGFLLGFKLASGVLLAGAMVVVVLHLINRGAGR